MSNFIPCAAAPARRHSYGYRIAAFVFGLLLLLWLLGRGDAVPTISKRRA